jgi:CheY-like chemotaxis protein
MAKVLVVEDDADSLEILSRTLEKSGHVVVPALNGWEALLALDAHHINAIILDLMMPGMNGTAFLRILRNDQRRSSMPVILLTALSSGDLLKSTNELGVQALFLKAEYTSEDLLDAIDRLCSPLPPPDERAGRWQNVGWGQN